jgi:hypothetical protein
METYCWKRYVRESPGALTGTVADTLKISASSKMDAENMMKRYFIYGGAPMQWDKYFMSLEDASGKVVATWLGVDDCT